MRAFRGTAAQLKRAGCTTSGKAQRSKCEPLAGTVAVSNGIFAYVGNFAETGLAGGSRARCGLNPQTPAGRQEGKIGNLAV